MNEPPSSRASSTRGQSWIVSPGDVVTEFKRTNSELTGPAAAVSVNQEKPTLTLPPGSDRMSPSQRDALFAEWRADYAAGKEGLEPPSLPDSGIDIDGPGR